MEVVVTRLVPLPQRKSMRLPGWDYRRADWCFVTICTRRRARCLARSQAGKLILTDAGRVAATSWQMLKVLNPEIDLDAWMVMPDHFHGLIRPAGAGRSLERGPGRPKRPLRHWQPGTLGVLINQFKRAVTHELRRRQIAWPGWHRGYHDRVVRDNAALPRIRRYIELNPQRWLAHAKRTGAR